MIIHFVNTDSSAPQKPRRGQRLKDARRQSILAAAEGVFGSCGYHEASLTDIAQEADLAVGTIYLHFEDKADLYGSLMLEKMKQMVERLDQALHSDDSPTACLRAAVHSQFAFHDANRRFFEIFLHQHQVQFSPLHPDQWKEMETLKRHNLGLIESCISHGQKQGELRPGNPRLYAVAFLGVTLQMIRQWIRENDEGRLSDSADFAADCFLRGASQSS